jgi:hypothetical protein
MADTLVVGLHSWIIQDGNYGDFARNTNAAFALEFYASSPLEIFESNPKLVPALIRIGDDDYDVVGQVIHAADGWWAIDVGVIVFQETEPPAAVRQGSWLRGKISIGIDPFFYFERLAHQPGAPALVYDWMIERIEMQTAPPIEVKPRVMGRDATKLGWKEILKTKAWEDEGEYLLHCTRIGGPRPPRSRRQP